MSLSTALRISRNIHNRSSDKSKLKLELKIYNLYSILIFGEQTYKSLNKINLLKTLVLIKMRYTGLNDLKIKFILVFKGKSIIRR